MGSSSSSESDGEGLVTDVSDGARGGGAGVVRAGGVGVTTDGGGSGERSRGPLTWPKGTIHGGMHWKEGRHPPRPPGRPAYAQPLSP